MHAVPEFYHAFHTPFRHLVQFLLFHVHVFLVIYITVYQRKRVVLYAVVSRKNASQSVFLRLCGYGFPICAMNQSHCLLKLCGKVSVWNRHNRIILPAILGAFGCFFPQHHFRVAEEIVIDRKAVRICSGLYPFRGFVCRGFTPLQEQDVRHHISIGVRFKGAVWQPDCPQKVSPFSQVFPYFFILGIHRVAGGDECQDSAGMHLA